MVPFFDFGLLHSAPLHVAGGRTLEDAHPHRCRSSMKEAMQAGSQPVRRPGTSGAPSTHTFNWEKHHRKTTAQWWKGKTAATTGKGWQPVAKSQQQPALGHKSSMERPTRQGGSQRHQQRDASPGWQGKQWCPCTAATHGQQQPAVGHNELRGASYQAGGTATSNAVQRQRGQTA